MKKDLTINQEQVLEAIKGFIEKKGFSPTFEELREALSKRGLTLKSNNSLVQYLETLENKGFIQKFNRARGIRLLNETVKNFVALALLGQANCGQALSFAEDVAEDYINISREYIRGNEKYFFFLKAVGDSMDRSGIKNGDLVLVKRTETEPSENQIVVAVINGLGTIKKFKKINGIPVLVPNSKNPEHQPIILHPDDQVSICGRVERVFNFSTMESNS